LRQLLTESMVVALLGGGLGLLLAKGGNALLGSQINQSGELALELNWRVLGFALGASTVSGFASGLVPAWLASRSNPQQVLKQGGQGAIGDRSRHRLQHALIVGEVALALALLAGAGQMMRGLQQFTVKDPGWKVEGLTVANLSLPTAKYQKADAQRAFVTALEEKLAALPGVTRAAVAWTTPIRPFDTSGSFEIRGRPEPRPGHEPVRQVDAVTPGYFEALGMRLLGGRFFTETDRKGQPEVVIVSESLARAFWPNASPIGQRIDNEEIVGVVNDVSFPTDAGGSSQRFQSYRPFSQAPRTHLWMMIRGAVNVETLRRVVASIDPDLPLGEPGLAQAFVDRFVGRMSALSWLLIGFGGLGLLLATIGIYGVISGFAVQRTNEIGVRLALGAQVSDVLWLVLGQGLRLTLLGVAIGLIGAVAEARLLGQIAPGLSANDPLAIVGVAVLLVGVAALACWLPAWRAARSDPMIALGCD
jgi:predicted permease